MSTTCEACGVEFEAATARRRFCGAPACDRLRARTRKQKQRGGNVVPLTARPVPAADVELGDLVAATVRKLSVADRLDTPEGLAAVVLAERLTASAQGTDTGSSIAALTKQLLATLEKALEGAAVAADPIDELFARRQAKLGAS